MKENNRAPLKKFLFIKMKFNIQQYIYPANSEKTNTKSTS